MIAINAVVNREQLLTVSHHIRAGDHHLKLLAVDLNLTEELLFLPNIQLNCRTLFQGDRGC